MKDAFDRAFEIIDADDRRKLTASDEQAAKRTWRRVFAATHEDVLLKAVDTWLYENPKGRPNVGKIQQLVKQLSQGSSPTTTKETWDFHLRWAVGILEHMEDDYEFRARMSEQHYQHTSEMAEALVRERGFQTWRDAKAYLEPHWSPSSEEALL